MEAEYNALSTCMRDVLPFKRLVDAVSRSIGISEDTLTSFLVTVWEDNIGACDKISLVPHLKPNCVEIKKIDTNLQKADILTKGLRTIKFREIRKLLCG
jgi:hypothetical protein